MCGQIAVASTDPGRQLTIELESSIRVASLPPVHRLRCSTGAGHVVWESVITSKLNAVATSRLALLTVYIQSIHQGPHSRNFLGKS